MKMKNKSKNWKFNLAAAGAVGLSCFALADRDLLAAETSTIITQVQVAEKADWTGDWNHVNAYTYTYLGTPGITFTNNRADWRIQLDKKDLKASEWLGITCSADAFRTHTNNASGYALTGLNTNNSGSWEISSVTASDANTEIPNSTNGLFLKKSETDLHYGSTLTAAQAQTSLKNFFAEGNFNPMDGVIVASPALTYTSVQALGWNIQYGVNASINTANGSYDFALPYNNGGTVTNDTKYTLNYAFIPHGTEGTVTGNVLARKVADHNRVHTYGGNGYSIEFLSDGKYLLTLDDYSPEDGILLLNAATGALDDGNAGAWNGDNAVFAEASDDGKGFLISTLDLNPKNQYNGSNGFQNTSFSFAFIAYDSTLAAPETGFYRSGYDPGGKDYAGARLDVTRLKAAATSQAANLLDIQSSSDYLSVGTYNNADYNLFVNGKVLSVSKGVTLTTVAQNDTRAVAQIFDDWSTATISYTNTNGNEADGSVAFGYFPHSSTRWMTANVSKAGAMTNYSDFYDAEMVNLSTGVQSLKIEGFDSQTDGILLATGFTNNNNCVTAAAPQKDGSWLIDTYAASTGADTANNFNLVFFPYGKGEDCFISGWIDGSDGSKNSSAGFFDMEKISTGVFELTLGDDLNADDGFLLLGLAGSEDGTPFHGLISYEISEEKKFLINIHEADGAFELADSDFMFAFFATDGSLQTSVPEPGTMTLLVLGVGTLLGVHFNRKRRVKK